MAGARRRIVVVGGGVAGLAAAYALARARQTGVPVEELLIEGKKRLGGVILTERVEGFIIEAGPDSFLEQKPEAAALCRELGLGDDLIGSNDHARRTYILHHGRLAALPDGLMLLVPTRIWPMVTTPLLPLRSKLGVAREWFTSPANHREPDESVASFVRRHFGDAMLENIAAPLLAGVYGGDSEKLSVRSVLPRFWEMEKKYGSLTRATLRAMKQRRAASAGAGNSSPPLFMTLRDGLDQLTAKLAGFPDESRVHLDRRVLAIEPSPGGPGGQADSCSRRFQIHAEGNVTWDADAVVLAMPAKECARVLASLDPKLSALLADIPYSSSMTISLAYGAGARAQLPPGFGFLVPHHEGRRMLACTFVHTKFDGRVPEGKSLLRCFLGGAHDPDVLNLTDEEAVALVRKELREILNFSAEPLFARVHRWPASMAQYVVGHAARLEEIRARLEEHPGLFLAGNAYSGIGISDCIRTGRAAAERALQLVLRN
ncbi:MAG: protoporphyrinogen oxidase [Acidobacteriia bacterium]|nr:protoporphyrinogen oxidase [Terriglobia bacterium]